MNVKKLFAQMNRSRLAWMALVLPMAGISTAAFAAPAVPEANEVCQKATTVTRASQINPTTVEVHYADGQRMTLDFYGENIFRMFKDLKGGILRDPQASPEAQILVDNPRKAVKNISVTDSEGKIVIASEKVRVEINKATSLISIINAKTGAVVAEEKAPVSFDKKKTILTLKEKADEYFYGGGVQNGRFSHKGKQIAIVNTNNWTDGGVASPTPYYWSTAGYGMMWYTFKPGAYDFGSKEQGTVKLQHDTDYLDVFFMVNDGAVALLNDFYQLTGNPVLLPKFGFYMGHLNAYNRDYWTEAENGFMLYEDGKRYNESQKDNGGIRESLNGEFNNYQFSARAAIDRYNRHDMPLGWFLPNDGYGAGYGQTGTLDGNIQNLKEFGDYARSKGVEIGLWTQSDLHPKEGIEALLQRDIIKEVRDAGVRVLKTDVAWVGAGYSFGLNGVADVGQIMPYYGNDARPFIISLDGWAGTQRYAGIWSGDQTGGNWEYIRFHIPTFIGSGLSGQPNITNDMDGIFGGKNIPVNVRDYQWKTFTPMELNMDGWGSNPKYPEVLGEPATSINRWYLKMKAELMPYAYSIAYEAIDGKPMIRAMFLDYPNAYTLGSATQYQFLYGPSFLVAPIYKETRMDKDGNDMRDGIYLPEGQWVDYYNGDVFEGGRIINNFDAPLWKMPVFVKAAAIIPMTHAHNNPNEIRKDYRAYEIYGAGKASFVDYDDDGKTQAYLNKEYTKTLVETNLVKDALTVQIGKTEGCFQGFEKNKQTELRINVTEAPKNIVAKVGGKKVKLTAVSSQADFDKGENVFFYNEAPNLNKYATEGSEFAKVVITKNPQLYVKVAATDITANDVVVSVKGFTFAPADRFRVSTGTLSAPKVQFADADVQAYDIAPSWEKVENADYYEIEFGGMLYSTIKDLKLNFEGLTPETSYTFKVRAVNKDGQSEWAEACVTTKANPLEFAIKNIKATVTCEDQPGQTVANMFDFDPKNGWHTKWGKGEAVPFDMMLDLRTVNQLERIDYLPREDAGNGTLLKGTVSYSIDKQNWSEPTPFTWDRNGKLKTIAFKDVPKARYVKIAITEAVGNFGSGLEMNVFKMPDTEGVLQGDINRDKRIDENDLTSYMNYTGLRKIDSDFDYVSIGDINNNGLLDAYDISTVGIELEEGVNNRAVPAVQGSITLSTAKTTYAAGETIEIIVKGSGLVSVNALSFALPYEADKMEFVGVDAKGMKQMKNLTYDRLHSNGQKALYPTFVNLGEKPYLDAEGELMVIKFKAKSKQKFNLKAIDGLLVDKNQNVVAF